MNKKNFLLLPLIFSLTLIFPSQTGGVYGESPPILRRGVLLVANPVIRGPFFRESVVVLIKYEAGQGSIGLILNKPSGHTPGEVMKNLEELKSLKELKSKLFIGGPVHIGAPSFLVSSKRQPKKSIEVVSGIYFSSHLKQFFNAKNRNEYSRLRVFSGVSSWAPGQLEHEMMRGHWQVMDSSPEIIFTESPEAIWPQLFKKESNKSTPGITI